MPEKPYILATAGHVDHGKSSLVKALTGTDPDRLPEEKARGITIDLGFAHLDLVDPSTASSTPPEHYRLGIVDVPGHEDFVKNMVAGVGSIDLALLVVAADDGWMPQTEEHLQILTYLGVERGVVALSKIDLATDPDASIDAVRKQLAGSPLAAAPIVPLSAITGHGLAELRAALLSVLRTTPQPRDFGKPRLAVDRVFTLRGIGTVVTGTLAGGRLSRGQTVVAQPSGRLARIRSMQNHSAEVSEVSPGMRVALSLPELGAAGADGTIGRGEVITLPGLGTPSNTVDVCVERTHRPSPTPTAAKRVLKARTRVRVHHGATNTPATLVLPPQTQTLAPGERQFARLRFEAPVFLFAGDRFIVRDWSEQTTLAGGLVLDPNPGRHRFAAQIAQGFLSSRAAGITALTLTRTLFERDHVSPGENPLVASRFSAAELAAAIEELRHQGTIIDKAGRQVLAVWWRQRLAEAASAVDAFHLSHPQKPGMPCSELRSLINHQPAMAGLVEALLEELAAGDFRIAGPEIRRSTHRLSLPPTLVAAGNRIRGILAAKPLEPPSVKELAPDRTAQQALRFLVDSGEAIELSPEIVLSADQYRAAIDRVRKHLAIAGSATASELRQALGTTRRVLIPLLERIDRDGITQRDGDRRRLRPSH